MGRTPLRAKWKMRACDRERARGISKPHMATDSHIPDTTGAAHWYSGPALWRKLLRVSGVLGEKTLLAALTLFYCLKDRDTPTWARGVIVGALGYLIMPVDMIPDILPAAGYADDWGAIVAALATVATYVKDEHKAKAHGQVSRLLRMFRPAPPPEFVE